MATTIGSVLASRYELVARLGEGGMGEVWKATHLLTGRAVAIKLLLVPVGSGKSARDARARFLLEAQSACAVDHPNVVQVFDFVEAGDEPPFIVMELLEGETLAAKLARESALPLVEAARLLLPLVSAVGTAHARGIIHRDLKPSNIFLSQGGDGRVLVKVLDFGIAKWLQGGRLEPGLHTQTGSTLGTPSYMSPEQATAERGVDHRTDVWSIGVILYECLSGARPVEGENAAQMVMRLLSSGIIPIEHLVPGLPEPLSLLIRRMLTREPSARQSDLGELLELLCRLSGEQAPRFAPPRAPAPGPAEPELGTCPEGPSVTPATTWVPPTRPPLPAGTRAPAEHSTARRSAGWLWGALALGTLALGGALWLRQRSAPSSRGSSPLPVASSFAEELPQQRPQLPEPAAPAPALAPARASTPVPAVALAPPEPAPHLESAPGRRRRVRSDKPEPSAAPAQPLEPAGTGLPRGAECDRSKQCASRLCVAFACQ